MSMNEKLRWFRAILLGTGASMTLLAILWAVASWQDNIRFLSPKQAVESAKPRPSNSQNVNRIERIIVRQASVVEFNEIVSAIYVDQNVEQQPHRNHSLQTSDHNNEDDPNLHKSIVLIIDTREICDKSQSTKSLCKSWLDSNHIINSRPPDSEFPIAFRRGLVSANAGSTRFSCPQSSIIKCTSYSDIRDIFSGPQRWTEFYRRYPDANGYSYVTNAVVSVDGSRAMIYTGGACGPLCGSTKLVMLTRVGGAWLVDHVRTMSVN